MSYYMQQTTYKHDYDTGGISPRNRQANYPYGSDAPRADISPSYSKYRPRYNEQYQLGIRDLEGQRYEEHPLTDRQRIKRGDEWIGGRRYEGEPMTDRTHYRPQFYESDRERRRDISPNRFQKDSWWFPDGFGGRHKYPDGFQKDNWLYPDRYDGGRHTSLDRPFIRGNDEDKEFMRSEPRNGRHTSLARYDIMDRRKANLNQYQDRGRNASPDRYYDRGRNGSPDRLNDSDRDRPVYHGYNEQYEKPREPVMDGYASRKMDDRTTYKDYGEFLREKIKMDEQRKLQFEHPAAKVPKATTSGVYLFIRTNKSAKSEVVKALQEQRTVLANSQGQLKGIATSDQIKLLEGHEGWNIRASIQRKGPYWLERYEQITMDALVILFWFPSFESAELWLMHELKFKSSNFPSPDGSDVLVAPISRIDPYVRTVFTYLVTEYPRAFDPNLFKDYFAPRIRSVLKEYHGIDGFTIQSVGIKAIRGNWMKPSSTVTCIRFKSRQEAEDFFFNRQYMVIREDINRHIEQLPLHLNWFRPTSFVFTPNEFI